MPGTKRKPTISDLRKQGKKLASSQHMQTTEALEFVKVRVIKRPNFNTVKTKASLLEAHLATGLSLKKGGIAEYDLAAPHRAPYATLRDMIFKKPYEHVIKAIDELSDASLKYEHAFNNITHANLKTKFAELSRYYKVTRERLNTVKDEYKQAAEEYEQSSDLYKLKNLVKLHAAKFNLVEAVNNLASNAPGLGPHTTTNAIVSDRSHLQATGIPKEPLSPRSKATLKALPDEPVAGVFAQGKKSLLTPAGEKICSSLLGSKKKNLPFDYVNANDNRIFRGALLVHDGKVYKPKNYTLKITGNFASDWVLIH